MVVARMSRTSVSIKRNSRSVFIAVGLSTGVLVVHAHGYEAHIPGGVKKTRCPLFVEVALHDAGVPFRSCQYDERGNYFLDLTHTGMTNINALRDRWYPTVVTHYRQAFAHSTEEGQSTSPRMWLYLAGANVSDLSPLQGLPVVGLDISETAVRDLSPLTNAPLEVLRIRQSRVEDLAAVSGCPLKYVDLRNTPIADLRSLQGCPIERLWIDGTDVKDLSPLKDVPLRFLSFQNTDVTDITPLGTMRIMLAGRGGVAWREEEQRQSADGESRSSGEDGNAQSPR
jgi:hypothetical protein